MRASPRLPVRALVAALGVGLVAAAVFAAVAVARSSAAPVTTSPPTIEGTPVVGNTLTAGNGGWANSPTSYRYAWQTCDEHGNNCATIGGATHRSYTIRSSDAGKRLRVLVTASNRDGATTANSHPTDVVTRPGIAVVTSPPTITGTPQVGEELTAHRGSWNSSTTSWSYQWQSCDQNGNGCASIFGATGQTYGVRSADVGRTIRVVVTGSGSGGSASTASAPTAVIASPAANTNPCSKLAATAASQTVSANDLALPNRLLISNVQFDPSSLTSRSTFTARFRVTDSCGRPVQGALVYASGVPFGRVQNAPEVTTDSQGWATIAMTPTQRLSLAHGTALQLFVRARKAGENLLGGISTRRLVQIGIS